MLGSQGKGGLGYSSMIRLLTGGCKALVCILSVGASLAIFLGFTVSGIHLGFPTLSLLAAFC
jgi:hypothetical protein